MEPIYKAVKKNSKRQVVFDTAQAVANIYKYNRKLGAKY